ncbi:aminomethyl-transferring glycine dehydrogenase subunit GcvPB [Thermoanaerobacterium thermosaccharolyticum]|uniref:aminomethyl-transferring glycine dehydrogenase subunit GcvPB n=1 Tax=Thermoanaerobacterium thermosaccharolyticum TaxID=1517 RepID=UPI0012387E8F|nr:aminomethyl-transferring glycine dehydrogenase subunit GcvPB [Thermoanaerobacterium thermosaccharolyticum]KAA5807979.1 glycine dehydrogenase subunit 2 [Thermoanaerobacterium thermosaccharolyticum]
MNYDKLIFEVSKPGHTSYSLPPLDVEDIQLEEAIPDKLLRHTELNLPEVSEVELIRHYTNLLYKNYSVDKGFYPLGSCTMKYNPKVNEDIANFKEFTNIHPLQSENTVQGALKLMYDLQEMLKEITGMDGISLQPAAGAHGELTGMMIIKAYFENRGEYNRKKMIVPDSAHGTNPASAATAGFEVVEVKSGNDGLIDIDALKSMLNDDIAGLMLTNPNTLGLFEKNIIEIAKLVHDVGGLLYYDGANMNANMGITRPGDMGFDVVHINLHKTFATPHGGGGPGSGPVGVKEKLLDFLPVPIVEKNDDKYFLNYDLPKTIGKVRSFYGNFNVLVKAYAYILTMGAEGLKFASEIAVLNANYLKEMLKSYYELPYDTICKHEFVFSGLKSKANDVTTLDVAKRLIDYGFHPPTIYFPLIIDSALMIEPTETESKETLDEFIEAMKAIAKEADENPEILKTAPHNTPVRRLDEVKAARNPIVKANV